MELRPSLVRGVACRRVTPIEPPAPRRFWHGSPANPSFLCSTECCGCRPGRSEGCPRPPGALHARCPQGPRRCVGARPLRGIPPRREAPCPNLPVWRQFAVLLPTYGVWRNRPRGRRVGPAQALGWFAPELSALPAAPRSLLSELPVGPR